MNRSLLAMQMSRLAARLTFAVLAFFHQRVGATPGDLDITFGNSGTVSIPIASYTAGKAVVVQSDGKILVAGVSGDGYQVEFAVVRCNADGSLDPTFNGTGKVTTFIGTRDGEATGLALQTDGKIVVVGYAESLSDGNRNCDFAVVRYNPDGSLDSTFNGSGIVLSHLSNGNDRAAGVVLQPDGKIVVCGSTDALRDSSDFAVVRYQMDGSLDASFGSSGVVITDFNGGYDVGAGIALQADGSIVVAGKSNGLPYGYDYDFAVARYHSDGSMDASFNGNGRVTTDVGSRYNAATSVALQTDGKIVVAGSASGTGFEVVRYDANGNLDATFNGGGRVATAFDVPGLDDGRGLALQADGKIVVAGSAYDGVHDSIFAVARYHSNGSLDNTFHQDGRVTTDLAKVGDANGSAVALQSDGKIVVVGTASGALAIARYEGMLEFLWGAKVTIVQWSGVVSRDYLVGCDGTSVITRNDLVFHLDGSVTAGVGTPLSAIRTIYLVPNSPQNAAAADRALGFNKYCSPVRRTGFELAGGVLLQERAWNIVVGGTRGKLPQTRPFYAIPRCPAPDDWIVPERRRATFTDESLKQLIAAKARAKFVPPQIVWAKLWLDSTGPLVVGWNQYGFVGERSFGVPSYRRDRVGQEMTIVTDDGGVGIGRITGSNIVASVPAGSSVFTHLYRLASDTGYNVETAVSVLERKREQTLNLAIGYAGTPGGRTVLEHWYNALWAFDGLPDPATSNRSTLPVYPDRVWEVVRSRGLGRWSFLRPVLSGYAVPAGISNDYFIPRKQSTLGNDANKKWAHADVDFDGLADVVLFAPSFSRGTIANSLFIRVRTDSTRPSLGIDSVHAVISGGALLSPLNLELSAGAADSFSIAMGVRLPRSRSYYNATFSVSLTGIDAKKRAAEGLTYKFMNPP